MEPYEDIKQRAVPMMGKSKMLSMAVSKGNTDQAYQLADDIITMAEDVLNAHPSMLAAYVVATSGLTAAYNAYEELLEDKFELLNFACSKMSLVRAFMSRYYTNENALSMYLQYALHIFSPLGEITYSWMQEEDEDSQSSTLAMCELFTAMLIVCEKLIDQLSAINPQNPMCLNAKNMVEQMANAVKPWKLVNSENSSIPGQSLEDNLTYVLDFIDDLNKVE